MTKVIPDVGFRRLTDDCMRKGEMVVLRVSNIGKDKRVNRAMKVL